MILKLYSHLKKNPTKQTFKGKEDRAVSCFQKALGLAVRGAGAPTRVVRIGIKCHVGALIPHPSITLFCSVKVLVGKSREFHLSPRFPPARLSPSRGSGRPGPAQSGRSLLSQPQAPAACLE